MLQAPLAVRPRYANAMGVAELSAAAQVERLDPAHLEQLVPTACSDEERVAIVMRYNDADSLPKAVNAGAIVTEPDATLVQIMHDGIKVLAGGYHGAWM
jgi:hypothetical protein